MNVVELAEVGPGRAALVGGKASGLAELIEAGERVPPGFCVTTTAHEAALHSSRQSSGAVPDDLREEIVRAYERLGGGAVAVRSSAIAEDLPHASFAGQHETTLNVRGADAVLDAVRRCWESLSSERAVAYRARYRDTDAGSTPVRTGVVVQRMVDPVAAGVLFTANPVTGSRTEMVVDAVAGLGDVVVEGSATADHYLVTEQEPAPDAGGCLDPAQLAQLRETGNRLQRRAGSPRDIEWAIEEDGTLWLLQSRAITTLFPIPESNRPGPRVYVEAGHMQGMLRPFTPIGMSAMRVAAAQWLGAFGIPVDTSEGRGGFVDVAGRMYLDLTALVRYRPIRAKLPAGMAVYGPRMSAALEHVLEDPRFSPVPLRPYSWRTAIRVAMRAVPGMVNGVLTTVLRPGRTRARTVRTARQMQRLSRPPRGMTTPAERVRFAAGVQGPLLIRHMWTMLAPVYTAQLTRQAAIDLLGGIATESEVDETLRGVPHNVTTEMDLALWRVASTATAHRDLLLHTPPADLAEMYLRGNLPEFGLGEFLHRYGHRGAAEVDIGVPRWAEDPTPVFTALAGYLRVTDPEQAADLRFARAADAARSKIDELVQRARGTRPLRARVAGFLLRRSRAIAGLRELPKFAWLHPLDEMRRQLLAAGAEMSGHGALDRAEDIMFLDLREALGAADGADLRHLIATRRAEYERELQRRTVPGLLLSDGTVPEALTPSAPPAGGSLSGMPAAPGTATGPARVIRNPASAHVEPGEILVAATTDPGWTPLFLSASALVTETGAPMAHGPTVAREYGIPVVVSVPDATRLISTGQLITVDGAAGTVDLDDAS